MDFDGVFIGLGTTHMQINKPVHSVTCDLYQYNIVNDNPRICFIINISIYLR